MALTIPVLCVFSVVALALDRYLTAPRNNTTITIPSLISQNQWRQIISVISRIQCVWHLRTHLQPYVDHKWKISSTSFHHTEHDYDRPTVESSSRSLYYHRCKIEVFCATHAVRFYYQQQSTCQEERNHSSNLTIAEYTDGSSISIPLAVAPSALPVDVFGSSETILCRPIADNQIP